MAVTSSATSDEIRARGRLEGIPPELLILIGSLSVQCGGGLATVLVRDYGPLPAVSMRIIFGAAMLLVLRPPRIRGASRAALLSCLALGLVLATMNSLFFVALSRIPIGVAVTIEFWGPLAVAVLGSRRAVDLVWVGLAAAGIYVLAGGRLTAAGRDLCTCRRPAHRRRRARRGRGGRIGALLGDLHRGRRQGGPALAGRSGLDPGDARRDRVDRSADPAVL